MDLEHLAKLVDLMNTNDLVEVEIETEESKIRLKKQGADVPVITATAAPPPVAMAVPAATAASAPAEAPGADVEGETVTFNSPMVGTFYSASSPTAPAYVKVGDRVGPKTTMCIIEAMKVMNEITADMDGEILEVLVQNGEAVEYGQPLFTIRPGRA